MYSDSFTILGLWVLGLATSNISESPLQTNEPQTLFLMTSLPNNCIPGLAEIKTYVQKMQDARVTKSLHVDNVDFPNFSRNDANFPKSKGPGPIPKKGCESPGILLAHLAKKELERQGCCSVQFLLKEKS